MCGISGAVLPRNRAGAGRDYVGHAIACQMDRGPDFQAQQGTDMGIWHVVLGHNRLSILDLSALGNQPMMGQDGLALLVFNGEIYNYVELREDLERQGSVFTGTSDTQVLLEAYRVWGRAAFQRFNGMFAFALLDGANRELLLVRDRFGVKPLHVVERNDGLWFASAPSPLHDVAGRRPDLAYALRGLAHRVYDDEDDRSPFEGIRSVRAGHVYRYRLDGDSLAGTREPYYDFRARVAERVAETGALGDAELVSRVASLLEDGCAIRTRSDVPVAVSLSGGLDSGSVALFAARHAKITGISFAHPDHPESEAMLAAASARASKVAVEWVWREPADMTEMFWRCLRAQQAPFLTGSVVAQYAVFERTRALGFKVLLGGQGGDEAFMGYRKFQLFALQHSIRTGDPINVLKTGANLLRMTAGETGQLGVYGRRGLQYLTGKKENRSLFRTDGIELGSIGLAPKSSVRDRQVNDVLRFSLPTLLRYEDRNSMANSIESRLPFLDYRMLELAVALPEGLKLRQGFGKFALRRVMDGQLPADIVWGRAKRGFDADIGRWLAAGLGRSIRERLHDALPAADGLTLRRLNADADFSDRALEHEPGRFGDAVTVLWLAGS